jgi:hypothetical protein
MREAGFIPQVPNRCQRKLKVKIESDQKPEGAAVCHGDAFCCDEVNDDRLLGKLRRLRTIEVVLSSVGDFSQFVEQARFRRRQAAGRVGALNKCDLREDTVAAGLNLPEQQPRNRA